MVTRSQQAITSIPMQLTADVPNGVSNASGGVLTAPQTYSTGLVRVAPDSPVAYLISPQFTGYASGPAVKYLSPATGSPYPSS